jgi:hypothetical protein
VRRWCGSSSPKTAMTGSSPAISTATASSSGLPLIPQCECRDKPSVVWPGGRDRLPARCDCLQIRRGLVVPGTDRSAITSFEDNLGYEENGSKYICSFGGFGGMTS